MGNVIDKAVSENKEPVADGELDRSGIAGTEKDASKEASSKDEEQMDTSEKKENHNAEEGASTEKEDTNDNDDERQKAQKEKLKVRFLVKDHKSISA